MTLSLPHVLTYPLSWLKTGRGCFCIRGHDDQAHTPDCRELRHALFHLLWLRLSWKQEQQRQEKWEKARSQFVQWHRTQGSFKGWYLGCQALRRLEAGDVFRASQLAEEAQKLLPQSHEAAVVKAWLSWPDPIALEKAFKSFEHYAITLSPAEILPWYALLLKTLQDIREASLPDEQPFSLALLDALLDQEDKPESMESLHLRQDLSPFEMQEQIANAFRRFSQCRFYPPALVESLRAHLWDAFYGLGHKTFVDAEREWRQRYWILGLILFPLLFLKGWVPVLIWAVLWIGRLVSYECGLQMDLNRGRERWQALMGPSPLPDTRAHLN